LIVIFAAFGSSAVMTPTPFPVFTAVALFGMPGIFGIPAKPGAAASNAIPTRADVTTMVVFILHSFAGLGW
jgi:hypothetical protein